MNTMIVNAMDVLPFSRMKENPHPVDISSPGEFRKMLQQRRNDDPVRKNHIERDHAVEDVPVNDKISDKRIDQSLEKSERKLEETAVRADKSRTSQSDRKVSGTKDSEKDLKRVKDLCARIEKEAARDKPDCQILHDLVTNLQELMKKLDLSGDKKTAAALSKGLKAVEAGLKQALLKSADNSMPEGMKKQINEILDTVRKAQRKISSKSTDNSAKSFDLETLSRILKDDAPTGQVQASGKPVRVRRKEASKHAETAKQISTSQQKSQNSSGTEWQGSVKQTAGTADSQQLSTDHGWKKSFTESVSSVSGKKSAVVSSPRKVFLQIVERAKVTHRSGMSEMKLQLKPKALGKIRMKLTLKDGAVTARLSVASSDVREMIAKNLDMLGQELREAGINLKNLDISQQGQGNSRNSDGEPDRGIDPLFSAPEAIAPVAKSSGTTAAHHAGDIDIVA